MLDLHSMALNSLIPTLVPFKHTNTYSIDNSIINYPNLLISTSIVVHGISDLLDYESSSIRCDATMPPLPPYGLPLSPSPPPLPTHPLPPSPPTPHTPHHQNGNSDNKWVQWVMIFLEIFVLVSGFILLIQLHNWNILNLLMDKRLAEFFGRRLENIIGRFDGGDLIVDGCNADLFLAYMTTIRLSVCYVLLD